MTYDAVIIGGGLAGSSMALLLRERLPDARILMLERQRKFDRKVGEATVEVSGHFLKTILGLDELLERDHLPKHGLNFWFHSDATDRLDDMTEVGSWDAPKIPSFLLDREKLDEDLLARARTRGVEVLRPARVLEATPGLPQGTVEFEHEGERRVVSTRWILDASGRRRWLGQKLGLHEAIDALPTNAMWGRWRGVKDLDGPEVLGPDPKNPRMPLPERQRGLCTNHFMGAGSWTWMIRLENGETSVGLVFDPRHYSPPKTGRARETYVSFLRSQPGLRELLADAELVEGDFRSFQHLPYTTKHYMGAGYALVGDAASFLDPFYSPGLDHLAMSVFATALILEDDLAGRLTETRLREAIETHDQRFTRSARRWFEALYRDKYELFGDAQLTATTFLLDTALYYLGVVGPALRERDDLRLPTLGLDIPQAKAAYGFLRLYHRRLTRLARKRQARGVYGQKNREWRYFAPSFGYAGRAPSRAFWAGLRMWFGLELAELNPFKSRPLAAPGTSDNPRKTTAQVAQDPMRSAKEHA